MAPIKWRIKLLLRPVSPRQALRVAVAAAVVKDQPIRAKPHWPMGTRLEVDQFSNREGVSKRSARMAPLIIGTVLHRYARDYYVIQTRYE